MFSTVILFVSNSGSSISFMKDIIKNKRGPLFQRSTFQMNIKKMFYSDALLFLDGIDNEEKIKYLSIFGEHPFYLEMIDKSKRMNKPVNLETIKDMEKEKYILHF